VCHVRSRYVRISGVFPEGKISLEGWAEILHDGSDLKKDATYMLTKRSRKTESKSGEFVRLEIMGHNQKTVQNQKIIAGCLLVITGFLSAEVMFPVLSLLGEHSSTVISMMMIGVVVACLTALLFTSLTRTSLRNTALLLIGMIVLVAVINILAVVSGRFDQEIIPVILTIIAVVVSLLVNVLVFSCCSRFTPAISPRIFATLSAFILGALLDYTTFSAMSRSSFDPVSEVLRWIFFTGNALVFAMLIQAILIGFTILYSGTGKFLTDDGVEE
jgi:hypothetical protein